jgi:hypothetical protein
VTRINFNKHAILLFSHFPLLLLFISTPLETFPPLFVSCPNRTQRRKPAISNRSYHCQIKMLTPQPQHDLPLMTDSSSAKSQPFHHFPTPPLGQPLTSQNCSEELDWRLLRVTSQRLEGDDMSVMACRHRYLGYSDSHQLIKGLRSKKAAEHTCKKVLNDMNMTIGYSSVQRRISLLILRIDVISIHHENWRSYQRDWGRNN